jgi:hypothetical protein
MCDISHRAVGFAVNLSSLFYGDFFCDSVGNFLLDLAGVKGIELVPALPVRAFGDPEVIKVYLGEEA